MTPTVVCQGWKEPCVLEVRDGGQLGPLWRLLLSQCLSPRPALCSAGGDRIPSVNKESTQAEISSVLSSPLSPPRFPALLLLRHGPQSSLRPVGQVWAAVGSDPTLMLWLPVFLRALSWARCICFSS